MFCTFSRHFHDIYLHFFLFLRQMGRAAQKNKKIIKTYVFAMFFSEILGLCSAHSFCYFFKKNQKNVKLTVAHQYWGAPQCTALLREWKDMARSEIYKWGFMLASGSTGTSDYIGRFPWTIISWPTHKFTVTAGFLSTWISNAKKQTNVVEGQWNELITCK